MQTFAYVCVLKKQEGQSANSKNLQIRGITFCC